jgi:transcription antitermination protein NusB
MNKIVSRRQIREKVLQILYAHEMTKDPIEPIIAEQLVHVENKEIDNFARMLIKHTLKNNKEYEALIIETVQNWDMERLAVLDSIIIKMCLSEFFYFPEIPTKVSINESIDLAKNFSTKNSGKFVNGVVDAILAKLKEKNKIKKKGKGLITKSGSHNIPVQKIKKNGDS